MKTPAAVLALLCAAGCYHAKPLEERRILEELQARTLANALASLPSRAGVSPNAAVLAEEDAVAVALEWNPSLRALRHGHALAESAVITASTISNPVIRLDAQAGFNGPGAGLGVQWDPPQPVMMDARKAMARARVKEVLASIGEEEWQVGMRVRLELAAATAAAGRCRVLEQSLAARQALQVLLEKRLEHGLATAVEVNLAQLGSANVAQALQASVASGVLSRQRLAVLLGVPLLDTVALETPASGAAVEQDAGALEAYALGHRPALHAARARFEQQEQVLRLEHARRWPWFQWNSGVSGQLHPSRGPGTDVGARLGIPLPIFDWNQGPIAAAEVAREQARDNYLALLSLVRADIQAALSRLSLQHQARVSFEATSLPALDAHREIVAQATKQGRANVVALLEAESQVSKQRLDAVELELQERVARLELAGAVGP